MIQKEQREERRDGMFLGRNRYHFWMLTLIQVVVILLACVDDFVVGYQPYVASTQKVSNELSPSISFHRTTAGATWCLHSYYGNTAYNNVIYRGRRTNVMTKLFDSYRASSDNDDYNNNKHDTEDEPDNERMVRLYDSSVYYDERKPRRIFTSKESSETESRSSILQSWRYHVNPWNDWGVERLQHPSAPTRKTNHDDNSGLSSSLPLHFPDTYEEVADAAVQVCAAVLYDRTVLDPNIVQNAYVGSNDIYRRRPTKSYPQDAGRIGIEIDGAAYLVHKVTERIKAGRAIGENGDDRMSYQRYRRRRLLFGAYEATANARALRRIALIMAGKLSKSPWNGYETPMAANNHANENDNNNSNLRPVIIYYNTVQHALAASQELQQLKLQERMKQQLLYGTNNKISASSPRKTMYDSITILSLRNDMSIDHLLTPKDNGNNNNSADDDDVSTSKRRNKASLNKHVSASSVVDPTKGIIIIVQPTDYNWEHKPPGPAVDAITDLQRVIAKAAFQRVPVILLSPRFLMQQQSREGGGGDQSGYQQSSVYGGLEPPNGPTPWLLRDFSPPSYCWIGNAVTVDDDNDINSRRSTAHRYNDEYTNDDNEVYRCDYSRLSLVQSVLHPGHSWNIFAAKECSWLGNTSNDVRRCLTERRGYQNIRYRDDPSLYGRNKSSSYEYICSTKKASGRPTRELMRRLFHEFASYECDDI